MIDLSKSYISSCLLWQTGCARAQFKLLPEDFVVTEQLDWHFKGQGEHLFLQIEKVGANTQWVIQQLANFYQVPKKDIGYSGLKDRQAITSQFFSIRLPGVKPNQYQLPEHDEFRVISHRLHDKKLKVGSHKTNHFKITLKSVEGDTKQIEERLNFIKQHGVPNLFDTQRFGKSNIERLADWLNGSIRIKKHNEKNRLISVLRSIIFNQQLAKRVNNNSWNKVIDDDIAILNGTNSFFSVDVCDSELQKRCDEMDIHPAGILVGETSEVLNQLSDPTLLQNTQKILSNNRVSQGYRSFRVSLPDLQWEKKADSYELIMTLPSGVYASGVVKQVFEFI